MNSNSKIFKWIGLALALALAAGAIFFAINNSKSKNTDDKILRIQFTPSENADQLTSRAKPLAEMLSKELNRPVKLSVSTDYNSIVEAMGSKKVDVGFLPPAAYVKAHDDYKVKLGLVLQRYDVDASGNSTDQLVDFYRSEILVNQDSGINSLADLRGKNIAVQDPSSSSGYIYPAYLIEKQTGMKPDVDYKTIYIKGHDQAAIALANHQVDATFTWQDVRSIIKGDVPTIFSATKVLAYSDNIPNDTISYRNGLSEQETNQINQAFLKIVKTSQGKKIFKEIYGIDGLTKGTDKEFDVVRNAEKAVEKFQK